MPATPKYWEDIADLPTVEDRIDAYGAMEHLAPQTEQEWQKFLAALRVVSADGEVLPFRAAGQMGQLLQRTHARVFTFRVTDDGGLHATPVVDLADHEWHNAEFRILGQFRAGLSADDFNGLHAFYLSEVSL